MEKDSIARISKNPRSAPLVYIPFMNINNIPWALAFVIAVALLSPLLGMDMLVGTGYHDTQRWLELGVLAAMALLAVLRLHTGVVRLPGLQAQGMRLLLLAGVLGLLSCLQAAFPAQALFEWGIFFFLLLTAWLMAAEVAQVSSARIPQALAWVVAGSLLYGFKALLTYAIALFLGDQPDPGNLIPGFDIYRFFNHGQTVTLPLLGLFICLMAGEAVRSRRWRRAGWVALVLWWMLLFVTAGRGTFIGVVLAMASVGWVRKSLAWPWVRTMAWGALGGLLAYMVLYVALPQLQGLGPFSFLGYVVQRSIETPGSSRGALWSCAALMVQQHPWLGAGPLHYAQLCAPLGIAAHPHNWVLQIAAEWGLPVLACLVGVCAYALRALHCCGAQLPPSDAANQAMLTCWLATGAAILLDGLVSGLLVMPVSQLWLAIYAGLAWGWVQSFSLAVPQLHSRAWRLAAGVFLVGAAGVFSVGVATSHRVASALEATPESELALLRPRAWGLGLFGEASMLSAPEKLR